MSLASGLGAGRSVVGFLDCILRECLASPDVGEETGSKA